GSTPLFPACEMGKAKSTEALIKHGAEVSITNNSSTTPLHRAAGHDRAARIKALVENSADINIMGNLGYTPVALAAKNGYMDCVKVFMVVKDKIDFTACLGRRNLPR
ncbi:ankyrin repeat-containing domain protein, partial [Ilyonectria destructans]